MTQQSKPLVDYYRNRPTFCTVNGAQPAERVSQDLDAAIHGAARAGARHSVGAQG